MVKKIKQNFLHKYYLELVIFSLALIIRYVGIVPGFPPVHPDEGTSYSTAIYMLGHAYKPDRFDYPAGMAFINALIYKSIFLPIQLTRLFISQPEMIFSYLKLDTEAINRSYDFLFGNRQVYALFWSRYIHATFGWLAVVLLYFIVKRLFNRPTAIAASGFLAVNYRHVLGSHFALPDVLGSFFGLLALLAATLLVEKKTIRRYVFVGITAGLYFSLKYQPFAFFPLIVAHLYWVVKENKLTALIHPYAFLALITAFCTFIFMNPYYFFNIDNAFFRNDQDYRRYQIGVLHFRPYGYFYLFHWGIGRLASVAVIIGAFTMLFRKPVSFILISSFSLIIVVFMTYFSNGAIYTRNFIAPMPYLMIFAGYAVAGIYFWMKRRQIRYKILLIGLVMLGINAIPAYNSFILSVNYAKPLNISVLESWLERIMPENIRLRAYQLFIDDRGRNAIKNKQVTFLDWDYSKGPHSLAEFQEFGDDFAILQLSNFQSITYWWRQFPKNSMFLQYSEVPYDFITNSFFGLTLRELLPYTVAQIYKPWQAAEEINYLIFKLPKASKAFGEPIVRFSFDKPDISDWKSIDPFELGAFPIEWNKASYKTPGSLLVESGGAGTARVSSPPVPVTPGKAYLVRGFMKEQGDKEATYDGYLRLDFYKNQEDYLKETMSLRVALSSRVLPNNQWTKKEFSAVAPDGANFATISFQRMSPHYKFPTFLDDIELFEVKEMPLETFPEVPYIPSTIPYKNIFYNGFI